MPSVLEAKKGEIFVIRLVEDVYSDLLKIGFDAAKITDEGAIVVFNRVGIEQVEAQFIIAPDKWVYITKMDADDAFSN